MLPSALIRHWLVWQRRHHRLNVPGFAEVIGATPAAVHNWLSGESGNKRGISEVYWSPIARFFGFTQPEDLLAAARRLVDGGTVPATPPPVAPLEHPATPALVAEYLRQTGGASSPRQQQPTARRAAARKKHGRQRAV